VLHSLTQLIAADETKPEVSDANVHKKISQDDEGKDKTINAKVKSTEPAKKKRKVIAEDSEDDITTATIPSPPKPSKRSTSPTSRKTNKPIKSSKSPPNEVKEPASEESDTASGEDEPDIDPKTKKKSAETMYPLFSQTYLSANWTPSKTSWAPGAPVPYSALCATFDTISGTTKRLEILSHLTKFYRTVIEITPDNLLQCVYLTINRIAPDYEGLELGIGESLLVKAIAESAGRSVAQVKSDLEKTGDLGDIAQVCVIHHN
jgi:DNA ligase-1